MEQLHSENDLDNMSICEDIQNGNCESTAKERALFNELILDRIILFLGFDSLLNFRIVCHKWYSVSEKAFWKKSRITYQVMTDIQPFSWDCSTWPAVNYKNEELVEKFKDAFPLSELPASVIKFQGYVNLSALDYILLVKGCLAKIKEIYFQSMSHRSCKNIEFDMKPYLSSTITKLDIRDSNFVTFTVPLDKLVNVKYLYLDNYCTIILNGKITPKELHINSVRQMLVHNGKLIKDLNHRENRGRILINDFVDFSEIKSLALRGSVFKIDMAKASPKLEVLELLGGISVEGWKNNGWETNSCNLDGVKFSGNSKMQLKSIVIVRVPNSDDEINLSSLPLYIEKLCFRRHAFSTEHIFAYPNLKYLFINQHYFSGESQTPAVDFTRCPSLEDFELHYLIPCAYDKQNLNMIKLPDSVRRMKFHGSDIISCKVYRLDLLVLMRYTIELAESIICHFQTNMLVVEYTEKGELLFDEEKISVVNFWKNTGIPVFVLSGFKWTQVNSFIASEFRRFVDAEGSCYIFYRGEPGKAISRKVFDEYSTL